MLKWQKSKLRITVTLPCCVGSFITLPVGWLFPHRHQKPFATVEPERHRIEDRPEARRKHYARQCPDAREVLVLKMPLADLRRSELLDTTRAAALNTLILFAVWMRSVASAYIALYLVFVPAPCTDTLYFAFAIALFAY